MPDQSICSILGISIVITRVLKLFNALDYAKTYLLRKKRNEGS